MNFDKWRKRQDPETAPYRPGVAHTQGFGLRNSDIGSPLHLGNDRGREPRDILAPFDCQYEWRMLEPAGVAGSVLQMVPHDGHGDVEIQVFHTVDGRYTDSLEGEIKRGETMPVKAGDIGLSAGVHTHTELIVRYNDLTRQQLREHDGIWLYRSGSFHVGYIWSHCRRHGLDYEDVIERASHQVRTWGIEYMSTTFAIRKELPEYRRPHWGDGPTIHIDTVFGLSI